METRPIELLGDSALLRARQAAAQALEAWRALWGLQPGEPHISCARAWESEERSRLLQEGWHAWAGEDEWATVSPELALGVRASLFGPRLAGAPGCETSVADELCKQAIDDLVARLLARGAVRRENSAGLQIPASVFERGSGAAVLHLRIEEASLLVVTRCASPARRDRAGMQPLGESGAAVSAVPVTLDAQLGEIDMDLATLHSLEAGDVIRLPARLDQPLKLSAPDGRTICFGDFGAQEGFRALSLRKSAVHEGA